VAPSNNRKVELVTVDREPDVRSRIRGCLLGGAVGDALGAPVEFMSLDRIRGRFGPDGPSAFEDGSFPAGSITDDTQMTLFTAEGLIRSVNRANARGIGPSIDVMRFAYYRWLRTQGARPDIDIPDEDRLSSWLTEVPELNSCRAPGLTCTYALAGGKLGTPDEPINDSKGCGGAMRIAPIGLAWPADPFEYGCEAAALTHGHPTGWLAAGFLAQLIREIMWGADLKPAIEAALLRLKEDDNHHETSQAVERAVSLADGSPGRPETVEDLGAGWIAEEAVAISVYCALACPDFETAVRLAVNHSGDSDSTGSITGQIVGTLMGESAIPSRWLERLELRSVIETVAEDLHNIGHSPELLTEDDVYDWLRYPGW
jgi:ADP-ribosylglycohydrolase